MKWVFWVFNFGFIIPTFINSVFFSRTIFAILTILQEPDYGTAERKNSTWGGSGSKLGNGCESSPKPSRRALASSEESLPKVNGDASLPELEALKQEILREMRREINRMKSEIIDGKFLWLRNELIFRKYHFAEKEKRILFWFIMPIVKKFVLDLWFLHFQLWRLNWTAGNGTVLTTISIKNKKKKFRLTCE